MSGWTSTPADQGSICPRCLEFSWVGSECSRCGLTDEHIDQSIDALRPGTILNGHYFVGLVLGHEGGFGVTYKGRDLQTVDKVAIKEYMPSELAGRSHRSKSVRPFSEKHSECFLHGLKRFRREAQVLRSFDHPSIVRVTDYFEENSTGYMVMPFIEGKTLADFVLHKGGRIDFQLGLNILTPVMDALRHTHAKNLIHRDVSPDNVYITADGHVILLDFGAARAPIPGLALTRIMKPGFSPPEVILGQTQGPYTDVYGLAATLYWVCTGEEPPLSTDRKGDEVLTPPSQRGADIPRKSDAALIRALSLRPEDRYQSIAELQRELTPPSAEKNQPSKVAQEDHVNPLQADLQSKDNGERTRSEAVRVFIVVFVVILVVLILLSASVGY